MTITIGVSMPPQHGDMAQLRKAWEEADRLGADRIYTFDHFFTLVMNNPDPTFEETHGKSFEATSIQAAMAVTTTRAEVSSLVHCTAYRNPNLMADIARTIDHLSGGRFVLGLGSGWFKLDFDEYGYEFGTVGSRLKKLEQDIETIKDRWTKLNPPPTRRIPILIGGGGEKMTLRIAAKHADIWHYFGDVETMSRKSAILDEWCAQLGRDPKEIERSTSVGGLPHRPVADPEAFIRAGFTHLVVHTRGPDWDLGALREIMDWRRSRG
ncbi:MAG TPA: LLM class F420-dependent oxidoreductase [Rhizomicrobium sp.]|nr:LLM class F420-dependent oxidoreductase [Rhizomicrobium sp.]